MKKSRYTGSRIVAVLKLAPRSARPAASTASALLTYYNKWKSQYVGMSVSSLAQLRERQEENGGLKRVVAELALMHTARKDIAKRKL